MNGIQIQKTGKSHQIHRRGAARGLPVPLGATVSFPRGIPGFEQVTGWRFASAADIYPFLHMNALEENVGFVCIETFRICPDYRLHLPFPYGDTLALGAESRLAVLSIVTVGQRPEDTTANLMSPLVVNLDTRRGEQIILDSSPYPLKFRIWDHLRLSEAEDGETEQELLAAMG
ncbi:MAG: flagellar assembly protein FliW [Lentisphaeria bacterium]|jgi:flagellar assembly factor FliW|nr:flagellar assembly protein FliW [Lentisphaeria bacterium]